MTQLCSRPFVNVSLASAIFASLLFSILYVLFLYIWGMFMTCFDWLGLFQKTHERLPTTCEEDIESHRHSSICKCFSKYRCILWSDGCRAEDRDHPSVISRRFLSCSIVCIVVPLCLYINVQMCSGISFLEALGIRTSQLGYAFLLPFLFTNILFAGPIALIIANKVTNYYALSSYPSFSLSFFRSQLSFGQKLILWRNIFVGPITEEFIYRACICPLLLSSGMSVNMTIFLSPMVFGVAHFHHMRENLRLGVAFKRALMIASFQFSFTTVFGWYASFLFIRTQHLAAPIIAHMVCNSFGFPDFSGAAQFPNKPVRIIILSFFVAGLVGFAIGIMPLTGSVFFTSIYWTNENKR